MSYQLLQHWPIEWDNFDVEAYKYYNNDVGNLTFEEARKHYQYTGYYQGALYRRIPTVLRYWAPGGLCNQLYSHLSMLTLANQLGVGIMLPPSMKRASLADQKSWAYGEPDELLDISRMTDYWASRNVTIVKGPFIPKGGRDRILTNCIVIDYEKDDTMQTLDLLSEDIKAHIKSAVAPLLKGSPQRIHDLCVHLQMRRAYLALHGAK